MTPCPQLRPGRPSLNELPLSRTLSPLAVRVRVAASAVPVLAEPAPIWKLELTRPDSHAGPFTRARELQKLPPIVIPGQMRNPPPLPAVA